MRKVALWLSLALLVAGLAGCAGSDDETDGDDAMDGDTHDDGDDHTDDDTGDDTGDDGDAGDDDGDGTGDDTGGGNETDQAPTASLAADLGTGSPGLEVTFTLDGEDPEGAAISWTFDADGDGETDEDGTELPTNTTFTYEETGEYAAMLVVSDGTQETNATLTIIVEVDQAELPGPIVFSGEVIHLLGCAEAPDSGNPGSFDGSRRHWDYDPALAGSWMYKTTSDGTGIPTHFFAGDDLVASEEGSSGLVEPETDNLMVCHKDATGGEAPIWVGQGGGTQSYTVTLYHPDHPDAPPS